MGSIERSIYVRTNLAKEVVTELKPAPVPLPGILLQVRTGKVARLGHTKSAIAKHEINGSVFCGETGLVEDEHVYKDHGGIERAIHGYNPNHYSDWRAEGPPKPALFDLGGFGENISTTSLDEENVCIGDLYRVGENVVLQVSEPRNPCYKLNLQFEWSRALKRIQSTGRVGWLFRVLKTGYIKKGDTITLLERPNPRWSVMNVQRVIVGKSVPLCLLEECSDLEVLTDKFRNRARKRLESASKPYTLVESRAVTERVKMFTFALKEPLRLQNAEFNPFAFAQVRFGPAMVISRSYSIVSGNLRKFSIGVALDDQSRGGSEYLHKTLEVGDEIEMLPGANPRAVDDEEICRKEGNIENRIVIIGGIGVTAFLPAIQQWAADGTPFEVHYAVRSPKEAAFLDMLPSDKTTLYAKSMGQRLDVSKLVPQPTQAGHFNTKIYVCGPLRLTHACKTLVQELNYPSHLFHSEDFGTAPSKGHFGDPFSVEVSEPHSGRSEILEVPSEKTLLQVLNDAGFDVMYSCQTGACGACKVKMVCDGEKGKVDYKSRILTQKEKDEGDLQSCVDRGVGRIQIEID